MKDTAIHRPKAGLLPLYLKLYDDTIPERRTGVERYLRQIAEELARRGIDVCAAPICRVKKEFNAAVADLEAAKVDAIVTLHLAYSPSLESVDALADTRLPIIMLDTTRDYDFGRDVDPDRIMYNHGIHGVQDLANLLHRRSKPFEIVAGHWLKSDVLDRCADLVRAAHAMQRLRSTRALRIGESFCGMGDFHVPHHVLRRKLGITVRQITPQALAASAGRVTDADVETEIRLDRRRFAMKAPAGVHRRSVRLGLALRHYLSAGRFNAFSMNFLAFHSKKGPVDTVPFLECSKAMERGIGYAGEGDVLTAALVGALIAAWPKTTFTEIFCPDWKGNTIFLSHMGEINPAVTAGRPAILEKPFPFTPTNNPAFISAAPAPGPAVFVNLAPMAKDAFRLIVSPVKILGDTRHPEMKGSIRGWMRPARPVPEFLEMYSRLGGTHHSALVMGDHLEAIEALARFMGLELAVI